MENQPPEEELRVGPNTGAAQKQLSSDMTHREASKGMHKKSDELNSETKFFTEKREKKKFLRSRCWIVLHVASCFRHPKAYGLDSGCVHGGWLTALLLPEKRTVSVPARRKYKSMA